MTSKNTIVKATAARPASPKRKSTPAAKPPSTPAVRNSNYRVRVRMFRHGLGDCFLLTFPRPGQKPFNMLIDCGALNRDKKAMTAMVEHIEQLLKNGESGQARLDVVVATHEHKDHLSGFNQARDVFNRMDIGAVWLAWTENLSQDEAKALKQAKKTAMMRLQAALQSPFAGHAAIEGVRSLLGFSAEEDTTGSGRISDALDYLKLRGERAGKLEFLEPGQEPLMLEGVPDVRVFVLGPPHDPNNLKTSSVTEKMKSDSVIYHLGLTGAEGMDGLAAALLSGSFSSPGGAEDRSYPFAAEHRIARQSRWFQHIKPFIDKTYDAGGQEWRKIEEDWLGAFGQLALDLDNDTNNTSLVLAFEFVKTGQVLLFVGDAQVGNWKSWENVTFKLPGSERPLPALDLVKRTVFYKVGHHCSHNATLKAGGLELMDSPKLIAFIPLDKATARAQGKKGSNGIPKGWDMPAEALYGRLREKAADRVVISDINEAIPAAALNAGVVADKALNYVEYTLT
jgi:hypothetical protein